MKKSGWCLMFLNNFSTTGYFYTKSSRRFEGIPQKFVCILVVTPGGLSSCLSSVHNNIIIEIPPPGTPNNMHLLAGLYPLLHLQRTSDPASNNNQLILVGIFHQVLFILLCQQNQPIVWIILYIYIYIYIYDLARNIWSLVLFWLFQSKKWIGKVGISKRHNYVKD